jgi:uroporphyrinogen-III decarboxylase
MRAALTGVLPDRVPFFPTIYTDHACEACGKSFQEALIDPALGQACMLAAALLYETDGVRFLMGPEESWYRDKIVTERDGKLVQVSRKSGAVEGFFDLQGGGVFIRSEEDNRVSTIRDVQAIPIMPAEEYLERGYLKDVDGLIRAAHERDLFVVGMCGGQTINFMVNTLGRSETALTLFYDDPQLALALIKRAVAISIEKGRAFVKSGVDCLYVGDSYASGSVISPDIYRRFCAPAYKEVIEEFHHLNVLCYKHCCGNYNTLLDQLPPLGLDGMDGLDPESGMSVTHTKAAIGDKMTLMGGLSCLNLLQETPEAVYEEARRCVLDGKPGGRFVLGSGCAVPRHTPPENLKAAHRAVIDHGEYAAG